MSQGLLGVRKAAKEHKEMKFTALLHHATVDLLRDSFASLKRKAEPDRGLTNDHPRKSLRLNAERTRIGPDLARERCCRKWVEEGVGIVRNQLPDKSLALNPLEPPLADGSVATLVYTPGMGIELDHLFVCTAPGAPEAEKLIQFGLHEGPPNQHPGQGMACRRFSFVNAMIELLWVSDAIEAQSHSTSRTLLWERWSDRQGNACPFGICVRPVHPQDTGSPFPAWEYRPAYLPDPLFMQIGEAGIQEPMWVHLSFMRRAQREGWFIKHPIGVREITRLTLTTPVPLRSDVSQKIIESGVLVTRTGATSLLEIEFDGHRRKEQVDFRPHLPVIFQL